MSPSTGYCGYIVTVSFMEYAGIKGAACQAGGGVKRLTVDVLLDMG